MRTLQVTLGTTAGILVSESKRVKNIAITADKSNTVPIFIGDINNQYQELAPGDTAVLMPNKINEAYGYASIVGQKAIVTIDGAVVTRASVVQSVNGLASPVIDSYDSAVINAITNDTTEIIEAPGENKQIWIFGILCLFDTADATCTLKSGTTGKSAPMPQADNGGFAPWSSNILMPLFKCATNEAFNITMVNGAGKGFVSRAIVSV